MENQYFVLRVPGFGYVSNVWTNDTIRPLNVVRMLSSAFNLCDDTDISGNFSDHRVHGICFRGDIAETIVEWCNDLGIFVSLEEIQ